MSIWITSNTMSVKEFAVFIIMLGCMADAILKAGGIIIILGAAIFTVIWALTMCCGTGQPNTESCGERIIRLNGFNHKFQTETQ